MEEAHPHLPEKVQEELDALAGLLRVLAEPNRLRVLALLMQRETCVCELLPAMGISQPLLSHHLSVLAEARVIRSRRQAQRIFHSIVPEALGRLKGLLLHHLDPDMMAPEAAWGQGPARTGSLSQVVHRTLNER